MLIYIVSESELKDKKTISEKEYRGSMCLSGLVEQP